MDIEELIVLQGRFDLQLFAFHVFRAGASLLSSVPPRLINQDPPHRLRGGAEEVRLVIELLSAKLEPRFMNEGGGLKGVYGRFTGHLADCHLPEVGIERLQMFFLRTRGG